MGVRRRVGTLISRIKERLKRTWREANSDTLPLRRRIRQAGLRKGKCTKVVHVRKVEGQGRCHEGYKDGTYPQEGSDQGEVVECWNCTTPRVHIIRIHQYPLP